jgi:hypothetical protein
MHVYISWEQRRKLFIGKVNGRFGGTCRLHILGRKTSQERNQHEAGRKDCFFPPQYPLNFNKLQGGICQKAELFKMS